jgi:hypothetical protein
VFDGVTDLAFGGVSEVPGLVGHDEYVVGEVDLPLVQFVECGLLVTVSEWRGERLWPDAPRSR